jgi:DNA-binding transcriptional MerR regulator
MFSIGDFARHGRVSVRMLRHYDAIGLLQPAFTDPVTGYRFYEADQLARLNRVVALKDLGFTLQQVQSILDDDVTPAELRGMLKLRQAELAQRIADDQTRLLSVESRLASIEQEGAMPADEVVLRDIPAVRVAELTDTAADFAPESITSVIRPLLGELGRRLHVAGVAPTGLPIASYEDHEDGGVLVRAAMPVTVEHGADFAVRDLPALAGAATILHHGSMDHVLTTVQRLGRWVDAHGYRALGYPREHTIECPADRVEAWVTELQLPLEGTRP